MCGIAGIARSTSGISLKNLDAMIDSLEHRGPDGRGTLIRDNSTGGQIGLGHRRLAILDLSQAGHQPMSRGNHHITFNGEIYNYRELKDELVGLGHHFTSDSDTEVILASIIEWGIKNAVCRFNGMFAFALYDEKSEDLYLVRDRAGVKPLYFCVADGVLLFASELKSLRKHPKFASKINPEAVASYFQYGYVPGNTCIYSGTLKLPPGAIATFATKSISRPKFDTYWNLTEKFNQPKLNIEFQESVDHLDHLLQSAFDYRMVSDVPVGVFLSGGYDSSLVAAMLQTKSKKPIKTFTIGFHDKDFNEADSARSIANALGTEHQEQICTEKQAQEIIPTLPKFFDEPFADPSAIPTILVSELARKSVTVALSADAGDELFGGYNKYEQTLQFYEKARRLPWPFRTKLAIEFANRIPTPNNFGRRSVRQLGKIFIENANHCELMQYISEVFNEEDVARLLLIDKADSEIESEQRLPIDSELNSPLNQMLSVDYQSYLPDDILTKVDRATMSVSLEGREPLLDYRVAEFAAQLPCHFKIQGTSRKHILKSLAHRYIDKSLLDRPKKGFSVPYHRWLRGDLKYLLDEFLSEKRINHAGILNYAFVRKIVNRFLSGDPRTNVGIWTILSFQMWHDFWIEQNKA